ncbi:MAG: aminodeoxychorismate synthase component I [Candidatus Omnitrophica bacterium]|nr:aminodeoxychorismate synthase component I [Candidatus Omnitrophota bacterium]
MEQNMHVPLPLTDISSSIQNRREFMLLDTARGDADNYRSYLLLDPVERIVCTDAADMPQCLKSLDQAAGRGLFAAGFFSYEAGCALEPAAGVASRNTFPLLWFGLYDQPFIFNHRSGRWNRPLPPAPPLLPRAWRIARQRINQSRAAYCAAVEHIRQRISRGETYQVNYSMKQTFDFSGCSLSFYHHLRQNQPVSYGALLRCGEWEILSYSPELFFRRQGRRITVKPMKGTLRRGATASETQQLMRQLQTCPKNRAENIMIVDMLRNDLGKICRPGSVRAEKLFTVEDWSSLLQMTSTITGCLQPHVKPADIIRSLFPSGSITGAPKINTMRIIRDLERFPRRIFCGAIGFFGPDQTACFNIAIRTILLQNGQGEIGIGSGITYASRPTEEYQECLLKAGFLRRRYFQLIETMRAEGRGIALLTAHLRRLRASAAELGFIYEPVYLRRELRACLQRLDSATAWRIRLLLFRDGRCTLETSPLPAASAPETRVVISERRTNSGDPVLRHKTTQRKLYQTEYRRVQAHGYFDVIFQNERGEITEGAISNIFIRRGTWYYTPPVACGLLPGVFRARFLKTHPRAREKILTIEDLRTADAIYCCNAVRGMVRVQLTVSL